MKPVLPAGLFLALVPLASFASLASLGACGSEPEAPATATSSGGSVVQPSKGSAAATPPPLPPPPPPLPAPIDATFTLPVRLPVSVISDLINAQLPTHRVEPSRQVTRRGSSPDIQASYEFWRDPVQVRLAGSTLHVDVPIRYAARFNARMKSPFGGWMTVARNEPWGTEAAPLRVTVKLQTRIDIQSDWRLSLKTTLLPPVHGPPPDGRICTGGAFKLCMKKASIAPTVEKQLDAELSRQVKGGAADFDRQAVASAALPTRVARVFQQLMEPRPAEHGRHMTLTPTGEGAAISMRQEGELIVVEPALAARLAHHEDLPPVQRQAVPTHGPLSALPENHQPVPEAFIPSELQLFRSQAH